jgi:hypothetical protein
MMKIQDPICVLKQSECNNNIDFNAMVKKLKKILEKHPKKECEIYNKKEI